MSLDIYRPASLDSATAERLYYIYRTEHIKFKAEKLFRATTMSAVSSDLTTSGHTDFSLYQDEARLIAERHGLGQTQWGNRLVKCQRIFPSGFVHRLRALAKKLPIT